MLRKFVMLLPLISIAATGVFLIACGGSSSTKTTQCTGSYTIAGDWQGTATSGSTTDDLFGVINSSGNATFFDGLADIATIDGLTGACSFSETLTAYESAQNGGPQTATGTVTGNVNSDTSITGSDVANSQTTNLSLSSYSPISSVTALSGTVGAVIEGQAPQDEMILTLSGTSSNITFTGTDENDCSFSGTMTEEATSNVYDVSVVLSSSNCGMSGYTTGTYTGTGFESSSDLLDVNDNAAGTYAYVIITSYSQPFVLEILPSGCDDCAASHRRSNVPGYRNVFGFSRQTRR
jgi:hypothetical protein